MSIKATIDLLAKQYKLYRWIFIGCDGGHLHFHRFVGDDEEHLLLMLDEMRDAIKKYFLEKGA